MIRRTRLLLIFMVGPAVVGCGIDIGFGDYFLINARMASAGPAVVVGLCPGVVPTSVEVVLFDAADEPSVLWAIEREATVPADPGPYSEFVIGETPAGFTELVPLESDIPVQAELGVRVGASNGGGFATVVDVWDLPASGEIRLPGGALSSADDFTRRAADLRC